VVGDRRGAGWPAGALPHQLVWCGGGRSRIVVTTQAQGGPMRAVGGSKLDAADIYVMVPWLCALLLQFSDLERRDQLCSG
jgi:hypothetical protein